MLKDEPEDLTHLAPTPGDVCVPLDEPAFLTDMLDDFILNGNYCPLVPDGPADPLTEVVCRAQIESNRANNNFSNDNSPIQSDSVKDVDRILSGDPLRLSKEDCTSSDGGASGDPFIYRDTPSRCSLGTDLHSPSITKVCGHDIRFWVISLYCSKEGFVERGIVFFQLHFFINYFCLSIGNF